MERMVFRWLTGAGVVAAVLTAVADATTPWLRSEDASHGVHDSTPGSRTVVLIVQPLMQAERKTGLCGATPVGE